jgi:phosphorylcholine metabolism protein LicD
MNIWCKFLILIIFLIIVFSLIILIRIDKTVCYLEQHNVDKLYRIMYHIDRIFSENNLKYTVTCGTLLGCVRHESIIPWDNDIDLAILAEDLEKFKSLKPNFEKIGMKIEYIDNIWRVKDDKIFTDIFTYKKVNDPKFGNKYILEDPFNRKRWPNDFFYEHELFPVSKKYTFGNFKVSGPASYKEYLIRNYGKNYKVPIHYGKTKINKFFTDPVSVYLSRSVVSSDVKALPSKNLKY